MVNSHKNIVGTYFAQDSTYHGFLLKRGRFSTIDFPSSTFTWITGLSPAGDIVGFYNDSTGKQHGFILNRGRFIGVDIPGAVATESSAISRGDVVGRYITPDGHTHAYFLVRACSQQEAQRLEY